jgi:hypothetical protein
VIVAEPQTALAKGAPDASASPAPDWWWRDPDKLLGAAIAHAVDDPAFASRLLAAVGEWARDSKKHKAALQAALKGERSGNRGVPYWQLVLLLREYEVLTDVLGYNRDQALVWLENSWSKSRSAIERRLRDARKHVIPEHRRNRVIESKTPVT